MSEFDRLVVYAKLCLDIQAMVDAEKKLVAACEGDENVLRESIGRVEAYLKVIRLLKAEIGA